MSSLTTEAAASAAAGVASTILGHPLDCVKVRLQTAKLQDGRLTTLGCARQMLRHEGLAAFARGVGPPLANAMLLNTVMFVCFAEARRHLPQTTLGSLLAGGFSGAVQAFLTTRESAVSVVMPQLKVPQLASPAAYVDTREPPH